MSETKAARPSRTLIQYIAFALIGGALALYFHNPAPKENPAKTIEIKDIQRIVGKWEGKFTWLDKTKNYPVAVTFKPNGTYVFVSVMRESKGKVEIDKGKVFLVELGARGADFTLAHKNGKEFLLGKIAKVGTYNLSQVKK